MPGDLGGGSVADSANPVAAATVVTVVSDDGGGVNSPFSSFMLKSLPVLSRFASMPCPAQSAS